MSQLKNTHTVQDADFEGHVLKAKDLILVDFWAEWCGPCKMLAPILEEVAAQFQGQIKVYKMDVDENEETPAKYEIRGIPTVMFFKNGQMVDRVVGAQSKQVFEAAIMKHLKS